MRFNPGHDLHNALISKAQRDRAEKNKFTRTAPDSLGHLNRYSVRSGIVSFSLLLSLALIIYYAFNLPEYWGNKLIDADTQDGALPPYDRIIADRETGTQNARLTCYLPVTFLPLLIALAGHYFVDQKRDMIAAYENFNQDAKNQFLLTQTNVNNHLDYLLTKKHFGHLGAAYFMAQRVKADYGRTHRASVSWFARLPYHADPNDDEEESKDATPRTSTSSINSRIGFSMQDPLTDDNDDSAQTLLKHCFHGFNGILNPVSVTQATEMLEIWCKTVPTQQLGVIAFEFFNIKHDRRAAYKKLSAENQAKFLAALLKCQIAGANEFDFNNDLIAINSPVILRFILKDHCSNFDEQRTFLMRLYDYKNPDSVARLVALCNEDFELLSTILHLLNSDCDHRFILPQDKISFGEEYSNLGRALFWHPELNPNCRNQAINATTGKNFHYLFIALDHFNLEKIAGFLLGSTSQAANLQHILDSIGNDLAACQFIAAVYSLEHGAAAVDPWLTAQALKPNCIQNVFINIVEQVRGSFDSDLAEDLDVTVVRNPLSKVSSSPLEQINKNIKKSLLNGLCRFVLTVAIKRGNLEDANRLFKFLMDTPQPPELWQICLYLIENSRINIRDIEQLVALYAHLTPDQAAKIAEIKASFACEDPADERYQHRDSYLEELQELCRTQAKLLIGTPKNGFIHYLSELDEVDFQNLLWLFRLIWASARGIDTEWQLLMNTYLKEHQQPCEFLLDTRYFMYVQLRDEIEKRKNDSSDVDIELAAPSTKAILGLCYSALKILAADNSYLARSKMLTFYKFLALYVPRYLPEHPEKVVNLFHFMQEQAGIKPETDFPTQRAAIINLFKIHQGDSDPRSVRIVNYNFGLALARDYIRLAATHENFTELKKLIYALSADTLLEVVCREGGGFLQDSAAHDRMRDPSIDAERNKSQLVTFCIVYGLHKDRDTLVLFLQKLLDRFISNAPDCFKNIDLVAGFIRYQPSQDLLEYAEFCYRIVRKADYLRKIFECYPPNTKPIDRQNLLVHLLCGVLACHSPQLDENNKSHLIKNIVQAHFGRIVDAPTLNTLMDNLKAHFGCDILPLQQQQIMRLYRLPSVGRNLYGTFSAPSSPFSQSGEVSGVSSIRSPLLGFSSDSSD